VLTVPGESCQEPPAGFTLLLVLLVPLLQTLERTRYGEVSASLFARFTSVGLSNLLVYIF